MQKILILGACGQIGVELTLALCEKWGNENVIASDIKEIHPLLENKCNYLNLDVLQKEQLRSKIQENKVTQIYLLAAILSATGEKNPPLAWKINMESLLNILELAKEEKIEKVFWPSSIAVFGKNSPTQNTPQHTVIEPSTIYGISKFAGENWCAYYFEKYGVDVRSIRYPGLISYKSLPGGGTTDYAIDIFYKALSDKKYTCFLSENTFLPMMYMPDAIKATIELMDAPKENLSIRHAYNISAMSFSPKTIAESIKKLIPEFSINYAPDFRQAIADSWPQSIDDALAKKDWNWNADFDLEKMTADMIHHLSK
ncbi:MAG: NAD-dependent epimerase/dehydratase family protein [Chitinophagaceae bacterium]|nr:NAD-dependent epimerase/dehydratase family protein [Chitinophagaceae bacterium]